MFYDITAWALRPKWDRWIAARLERGTDLEKLIIVPRLQQLGVKVLNTQVAGAIEGRSGKPVCTLHIDMLLEHRGQRVVCDAKSMHPLLWGKVNSVVDLLRDKFGYRYPWQLLLYMYHHDIELGMFLIDDCLGHWKTIGMCLMDHLPLCEEALARCEQVMAAVDKGEPPSFLDDPQHCRHCWCFEAGVCSPSLDFTGQGIQVVEDDELSDAMAREQELRESAGEHQALVERIRAAFKARSGERFLCGDFAVTRRAAKFVRKAIPSAEIERVTVTWGRLPGSEGAGRTAPTPGPEAPQARVETQRSSHESTEAELQQ